MSDRRASAVIFAAQDPAHARLVAAIAVTAGVLLSAVTGQVLVRLFHAETGLLAMSIFLSVQSGSMVKDATARARAVTTALLIPALVTAIAVAAFLSVHDAVVIFGFVVIAGAAIWVRRYGARAAAIGSLSFMGYFFTLFMKPAAAELPAFLLIAAAAAAAQVVVRAALLIRRPRRELEVLLRELRAGSALAIRASGAPSSTRGREGSARVVRAALARVDDVGRAITIWQHQFQTEKHVSIDARSLAEQVLDARVDIEEAAYERARRDPLGGADEEDLAIPGPRARAERALSCVLDSRATPDKVYAARGVAERVLSMQSTSSTDVEAYLLARAAVSHARLRDIDLAEGLLPGFLKAGPAGAGGSLHASRRTANLAEGQHARPSSHRRVSRPRGRLLIPLRAWAPTSRMAVQAMIAASFAAGIGEAISATRWYWAVMTAFVIFIGATTRSGILTRAYRRVLGTALGIVVGIGSVALAGSDADVLVAICVVAVFGMLYFGPLNYVYSTLFITAMLVSLYRMLGVLDGTILELRLVETISGAVIGVLCAYLILSTDSRTVLLAKIDAYFDALDRLLSAAPPANTQRGADLMSLLQELETTQSDLDQTVSSMSAALSIGGVRGARGGTDAVHLMYIATRSAARLVDAEIGARSRDTGVTAERDAVPDAVLGAVDDVMRASARARAMVHRMQSSAPSSVAGTDVDVSAGSRGDSLVVDRLRDLPAGSAAERERLLALAGIDWALRRIARDHSV